MKWKFWRRMRVVGAESPLHEAVILKAWETGKPVSAHYDERGRIVMRVHDPKGRGVTDAE